MMLLATSVNVIKWWPDSVYEVHCDMNSHKGGAMSLGHRLVYSYSREQKLVTKSSTKAKIVGAANVLPQQLWTGRFLEAQGYKVDKSIMYQDNLSATTWKAKVSEITIQFSLGSEMWFKKFRSLILSKNEE
eukprot:1653036-Ditylum_brightwellii.AAC.1